LHLINIVDTIRTNNIIQTNDTIQRIVDSCPRLADLTLEECATLQRVSVLDRRLRRFALRCCHGAVRVTLDASELTTLDYKGAVPPVPSSSVARRYPRRRSSRASETTLSGPVTSTCTPFRWVAASKANSSRVSHLSRACSTSSSQAVSTITA
jgi:hypothetical protein